MEILFKSPYEIGMFELRRDSVFRKIAPERYQELIDFAWHRGEGAAQKYIQQLGTTIPSQMVKLLGITVEIKDWNSGKSKVKFYSEYADKGAIITLYENTIREALQQSLAHGHKELKTLAAAKELFLAHELYHHIECRDLGLATNERKVSMIKLGPFTILDSGIRALCEIGAHAFSRSLLLKNAYYQDLVD